MNLKYRFHYTHHRSKFFNFLRMLFVGVIIAGVVTAGIYIARDYIIPKHSNKQVITNINWENEETDAIETELNVSGNYQFALSDQIGRPIDNHDSRLTWSLHVTNAGSVIVDEDNIKQALSIENGIVRWTNALLPNQYLLNVRIAFVDTEEALQKNYSLRLTVKDNYDGTTIPVSYLKIDANGVLQGFYQNPFRLPGKNYHDLVIPANVTSINFNTIGTNILLSSEFVANIQSITFVERKETDAPYNGVLRFENCEKLQTFVFPNYIGTNKNITSKAFLNCKSLTNIIIPDTADYLVIESQAFANCVLLKNFALSKTINTILKDAFYNCQSISEYDLRYVTNLSSAFAENINLETVWFGTTLNVNGILADQIAPNELGAATFKKCTKLKTIAALDTETDITTLTDITNNLPQNITSIGKEAFYQCKKIDNISFHRGLVSLNDFSFYQVPIVNLSLPDTIQNIHPYAFGQNPLLQTLNVDFRALTLSGAYSTGFGETAIDFWKINNVGTRGTLDLYAALEECGLRITCSDPSVVPYDDYEYYLNTVTYIPAQAQRNGKTKLYLPSGMSIDWSQSAFDVHRIDYLIDNPFIGVTDIVVDRFAVGANARIGEDSVFITHNTLPFNVFKNNTTLTNVTLRDVHQIGESAFENCTNLQSLVINDATTLWNNCLNNVGILSLNLPSITTIHTAAIAATALTNLTLKSHFHGVAGSISASAALKTITLQCNGRSYTDWTTIDNLTFVNLGLIGSDYHLNLQNCQGTAEQWKTFLIPKGIPATWVVTLL